MRSEIMLDHYGVTEENWRDALVKEPHFIISETPRFVGRAIAALAGDPNVALWNLCQAVSSRKCMVFMILMAHSQMPGDISEKCRMLGNQRMLPSIANGKR